ncbi:MAG: lysine--tRNA ligase [Opitutales bacterium]
MSETQASAQNQTDVLAVRQQKLEQLRQAGRDPFQANWSATHSSAQALAAFPEQDQAADATGPEVSVAGRIVTFRLMGKACFVKLLDRAGQIQLYVTRDALPEGEYNTWFKKLDLGDFIGARGTLFKTKTGEITVRVSEYALVSKSLRPLPEKWHGLADPDQIYRQRYLDLIVNRESRTRFLQRSAIVREVREFLWDRDFVEVETPCLQTVPGGAAARPFTTHFNALNFDFRLRVALELYLKRMLVGGFDRVFEIGRIFRNEGLSRRHNPEFTMLEVYQAYTDFRGMMELVHALVQRLCVNVLGTTQVARPDSDEVIELGGAWREAPYKELILENTGDPDWFSRSKEEKLQACAKMGIEVNPALEDFEVTNNVFEKRIEPNLIQPTFVTHIPRELCPLAKLNADDPQVLDVFELCINGQEIAPAYSEQNDPVAQRQMFEQQAGEEVQRIDYEFLTAMEHGMPPAGGMGIGIDRLVIFLTSAPNIRDTILFPSLKPSADA